MILHCGKCGYDYDAGDLKPGSAVRCECGDLLSVPEPAAFEAAGVVDRHVDHWAQSLNTTAAALAVDGGWEFIAGSCRVQITKDESAGLVRIESRLFAAPEDNARRLALFTRLLELNAESASEARLALDANEVVVQFTRPTLGLDFHEFQRAVTEVAQLADDYDDELISRFASAPPEVLADESDADGPE